MMRGCLWLKSAASILEAIASRQSVSRGNAGGDAHIEVRDAQEDRVKETAGAMELTED